MSTIVAAGISEEALAAAQAISFFPDEDDVPRDASGAPEAVRVGGGVVIPGSRGSEATEAVQGRSRYAPDPVPVRAGSGTGIASSGEVEKSGVHIADAEVVEAMFGLPSLAVLVRPDNQEESQ